MKKSADISSLIKPINRFFGRYHSIIYFVAIGIGLTICLVLIINTLNASSAPNPSSVQTENTTFDEATIQRLRQLDSSSTSDNDFDNLFKQGRSNPFVE